MTRSAAPGLDIERLARLAPLASLSRARLAEVAAAAHLESAARGSDPLKERVGAHQSAFLMRGEMLLIFAEGRGSLVVVGGSGDGLHPLNRRRIAVARSLAITEVELLLIDDDALDIVVTWDEAAAAGEAGSRAAIEAVRGEAGSGSRAFSLANLRHGIFARLPAAHIEALLRRFERVPYRRGATVIREGDEGDWFYLIESGKCRVERMVGGVKIELAELRSGDAFGEESLVADARRNATVTMDADGSLLRLAKRDFTQLLAEPLLHRLSWEEAQRKVAQGAQWLDVRYPSEYLHDRLPGAVNVPLSEVRNSFAVLDADAEYIVYCQTGRRSSAAAFLFAQRGFKIWLLEGGLRAVPRREAA